MEWFTVLMILIIVIAVILKNLIKSQQEYPYVLGKPLLSKAERSFYGVLSKALPEDKVVLAKVRVADVLAPKRGMNRSDWQRAFNKISAKHFDYVVCDAATMAVRIAVELDDASHQHKRTQLRDKFLNGACDAAGLPLKRFRARKSYVVSEVMRELELADEDVNLQAGTPARAIPSSDKSVSKSE